MGEVSKSPGMGIFLSHQGNKKYTSSSNTHPDENYARELMQLFSLGLWKMNQDGSMIKDSKPLRKWLNQVPTRRIQILITTSMEERATIRHQYGLKMFYTGKINSDKELLLH